MNVNITDIQRFCMHDGPGIRTVVFFKGCPLRCKWCHNPETQSFDAQIYYDEKKCLNCGRCGECRKNVHEFAPEHIFYREKCAVCGECASKCPVGALSLTSRSVTTEYILEEVKKDIAFYGKNGGITLSGGEPMAQPEAAIEIFRLAKDSGISTALETCGFFNEKYIPELCKYVDTFLWDFKDSDDERHMANTGVSNEKILRNLRMADTFDVRIVLRCILIKGINYDAKHLTEVKKLKNSLKHCERVDFIPYHPMGESKSRLLGRDDFFSSKELVPTNEEMEFARQFLL